VVNVGPLSAYEVDLWLDPRLIECGCWRCRRGGRCSEMQDLYRRCAERDDRLAKLICLTDDDIAWLTALGWDGT
jgi:hypothetical protein